MPELPEVETVRRGLMPYLEGARISAVRLNRQDLRFAFPDRFAERMTGQTILEVGRRAKYLIITLSDAGIWLSHLGMTGSYRFSDRTIAEPSRYFAQHPATGHDHAELLLEHPMHGSLALIYSDPRRFGFMDLTNSERESAFLTGLGPEPLSNAFNAQMLAERLVGRRAPIKAALLDQRVVAGLGNIYVSEALYRTHIRPETPSLTLVGPDGGATPVLEALVRAIRAVLEEAISAGGSTLQDFRNAEGNSGYFQHRFAVYDREGEPCLTPDCTGRIERIVQSGRSSFFCPVCQH